jgi:PAS domain S-box-containing protein
MKISDRTRLSLCIVLSVCLVVFGWILFSDAALRNNWSLLLAVLLLLSWCLAFVSYRATPDSPPSAPHVETARREISDYKYALDESAIVAITDQRGIITHVNNNFSRISKYSKEELIGQDHRIINSSYHSKEFIKELWRTIAHGNIWRGVLRNRAKDGTFYWVDTTIVPFLNDAGKPYQYIAIRSDVTQQKRAEEELIKSERIYKSIASAIPGAVIFLLDTDMKYFLIEGDMLENLGYSRDMLLGKKPQDVLLPGQFEPLIRQLQRVLQGEMFSTEVQRKGYDLVSRFVPLKDEQKNVYAIMIIVLDVTDLKRAERHISELNADLERRIVERTEQLASANRELEAFSYSVAHDLRTPLRGVAGYATMLAEDYADKIDADGQRFLQELQYNTEKMGALIDDLLTFSRLGRKPITKAQVDMNFLVSAVLADLPRHNASIEARNLEPVIADASLISHVLINLLSNAVKYSSRKPNPKIEIASQRHNGMVIYTFRDNGVGFDMKYADKLFGVFQRLHTDEEFDGTGVGLAIVQRIIHRHGGSVWAEARPDEGATFYFSLPYEPVPELVNPE